MFDKIASLLGIRKSQPAHFKSRRVLVVDDSKSDLLLIKRTVERMGHQVFTAENGKSGLEIARKEKPDLILSDCNMPEMDGVRMCKEIKDDPQVKNIPLIFLTGVDTPSTVIECFDMGVDNYIGKPINPKLLADQITKIFEERPAS